VQVPVHFRQRTAFRDFPGNVPMMPDKNILIGHNLKSLISYSSPVEYVLRGSQAKRFVNDHIKCCVLLKGKSFDCFLYVFLLLNVFQDNISCMCTVGSWYTQFLFLVWQRDIPIEMEYFTLLEWMAGDGLRNGSPRSGRGERNLSKKSPFGIKKKKSTPFVNR
jgi:hypothetical protein